MTRVTETRLADGRALIYFDDDASPTRTPSADARDLPPRPATPRMRQDALTGDWITMAASRQGRVHLPSASADPLAPQTPTNPSEIPDDYEVAVFENRSPAFGPGLAEPTGTDAPVDGGAPAIGRCEVVCFGPEHEGSFASQTVTRARTIVDAWAHRTAALQAMDRIEQVFVFENRGVEIGVTLHHPHGQIYGYPYVTPRTQRLLAQRDALGSGMQTALLASELDGPRIVEQTEHWVAFVPFAARWPIELHVMPRRPVPDLPSLDDAERDDLASLSLRLLRGVDALYDTPTPYIAAWHQAPVGDRDVHLTWQITSPRRAADRLKFTAGSEAAMGAWVGDVLPETQAEQLRAAIGRAHA